LSWGLSVVVKIACIVIATHRLSINPFKPILLSCHCDLSVFIFASHFSRNCRPSWLTLPFRIKLDTSRTATSTSSRASSIPDAECSGYKAHIRSSKAVMKPFEDLMMDRPRTTAKSRDGMKRGRKACRSCNSWRRGFI
jgi:hypothetical protein